VIESLPQAFEVLEEMGVTGQQWEGKYRVAGREALKEILEGRMSSYIDRGLEEIRCRGGMDRSNGIFSRHLLTELGDIELCVPRTRSFSAVRPLRAYGRRVGHVDRMILACFVLGVSTRKVAQVLLPILGEPVSATTVSEVAKALDGAVEAFHRRPLRGRYRFLILDGVVLKRRTGAGAMKRVVLVALGITAEGKKEVIDFWIARGESQQAWEGFLNDLYNRGLDGEGLEMIVTDGAKGLLAALSRNWSRGGAAFLSASSLRRLIFQRIWPPGDARPLPRSASALLRPRGLPPGPNPGKSKRLRQAAPRNAATL
jgi:putative transposase